MSNSSFFSTSGATSNQTDAIEASVNNAAASEAAALASKDTSTAQATISTDKATESAASAAAALVSQNSASSSSTSANTSKNSASVSASAASSSASAASGSASTASSKAAQALSSSNSSSSSASTSSTARDASIAAKNSSVTAQGLSEAARDASIVAKDASVVAKTSSETAATNAAASSTTSTTKANESAASAAAALSSKNSSDTNSATATTKASEAASSATASAASATASAASATTSTASKDTAVAVTANFLGAHSSAPTATASGGSLAVGMLYFDTGSDVLKVRASGGWINAGSSVNGTSARFAYTLTANQTTVSGNDTSGNALAYDSGFADVYLNGVKLAAADFTATSGSSIVLAAGATANDILEVVAFGTFQLSNGTFAGTTTVNNLTITGTTTAPTQAESDDSTKIATTAYVVDKITTLIGGAPSTLNDLNELAAAINDDANYNSTLTTALATKMPKSGGAFTGAVTTNSTFDGVDIATRDAVLTATTTTANAALPKSGGAITGDVTFGDGNKAIFGAGSDLKIYHSGSSSIIDNTTGGLFFNQWVDNADITFQNDDGTGGTTTYLLMQGSTGEVQLKHYGSTKISTKAAGVEVAGNMVVSGTVDGVDIATRDAVLTATTTTANAALPKAGGAVTGNVTFGDNNKAVFGAGSDLQIYHDGSNSIINDAGDGTIRIQTGGSNQWEFNGDTLKGNDGKKIILGDSSDLQIYHDGSDSYVKDNGIGNLLLQGTNLNLQSTTAEDYIRCTADAQVELYHNNVKKFETTSTGVNITGTTKSSGTFSPSNGNWANAAFKADGLYGGGIAFLDGSVGWASYVLNSGTTYRLAQGATSGGVTTKLEISGDGKLTLGSGNDRVDAIEIATGYSSDYGRTASINWTDVTNVTGAIDTRYDGNKVDMFFGSLFNAGYNSTDRMAILGNGKICFGKTNDTLSGLGTIIYPDSGGITSTISSGNTYHVYSSSGYRFYVNHNGGIYNYQSNNVNLSDEREKKNIEALGTKWDAVKAWSVKEFHYNADENSDAKKLGVIAQDVESNHPELVTNFNLTEEITEVKDEDGNITTEAVAATTRKAIKEQQMMWIAIKALQEAQTRIEELETKVTALEA